MVETEQVAGSFSVSANAELLRVLKDIEGALSVIWETTEKSGQSTAQMTKNTSDMFTTMTQHIMLVQSLKQQNEALLDITNRQVNNYTNINKELDDQREKQRAVTGDTLSFYDQLQERIERHSKHVTAARLEREKELKAGGSSEHAPEDIAKVIRGIGSGQGGSMLLDSITKRLPQLLIAKELIGASVGGYREMAGLAYSGGQDVTSAFSGQDSTSEAAANYGKLTMQGKLNSMMGYASEQESKQALSTLIGKGGFRGDELVSAFDGLAKAAHHAGIGLKEYADVIATVKRTAGGTMETSEIKEKTEWLTELSKKLDVLPKDVLAATTAAYQASGKYDRYADYEAIGQNIAKQMAGVYKGVITPQEVSAMYSEGARRGFSTADINAEMNSMVNYAMRTLNSGAISGASVGDIDKLRRQIADAITEISPDYKDAFAKAKGAAYDLAGAINLGTASMTTFNNVLDPMVKHMGKTPDEAAAFSRNLDTLGKGMKVSGEDLSKNIMDLAMGLQKMHGSFSQADLDFSKRVMLSFGEEIKSLSISAADVSRIILTSKEAYSLSNKEAESFTRMFTNMNHVTGVAVDKLFNFSSSIANNLVPMFDDPKEAAILGAKVTTNFARMLNEGTVTSGELTSLLKTQLDVFGKSAPDAASALDRFKDAVENSNVRMDMFNTLLTANHTTMKKYGVSEESFITAVEGFSSYLKDTSVSMNDFNQLLKGPVGMSEGVQAMAYTDALTSAGPLGALARASGGPLGFIEMQRDVALAAGGGDPSEALKRIFKGQNVNYQELNNELTMQSRTTFGGLAQGIGATDVADPNSRALLRKLLQAGGMSVEAAGKGGEDLLFASLTGTLNTPNRRPDEDTKFNKLVTAYEKTADSFKYGTDVFVRAIHNFDTIVTTKVPPKLNKNSSGVAGKQ